MGSVLVKDTWPGYRGGESGEMGEELCVTRRALEPRKTLGPSLEAASQRMRWENHQVQALVEQDEFG